MTDTEPTTRPIHERVTVSERAMDQDAALFVDGSHVTELFGDEAQPLRDLLAAAGKVHAVLVDLPDVAGGGQLYTWSYPNGAVEASWRQSARDTWYPVELLDGGSVCVAP